jgi:hypothetical protein
MTAKRLSIKGKVVSRADAEKYLKRPGDAVIVDRQGPRWLILLCPCGCGTELPINLDRRAGPAWRIYNSPKKGVSVYPSIWRESDCESHFTIRNNKISMMQRRGAISCFGRRRKYKRPIEETVAKRTQSATKISKE